MAKRIYRQEVSSKVMTDSWYQVDNLIYYFFGIIELLLTFRLIFRLFGANTASGFVRFIYGASYPLVYPFINIFPTQAESGLVFDPSILVALLVYAIMAKIVVELIRILSNRPLED